jgi:hypothetical protein
VQACQEAGLLIPQPTQQQQQQGTLVRRSSSSQAEDDSLFDQQQQQQQQPALELFDILGLRTRMLLQSSNRVGLAVSTTAAGDASSGPELLQLIKSEYHQYLANLMGSL